MQKKMCAIALYTLTLVGLGLFGQATAARTITGGSLTLGTATVNSAGMTVASGLGSNDGYKFEGAGIGMFYDTSVDVIYFKAAGGFNWERTGASLAYTSNGFLSNSAESLGSSGSRWGAFYLADTLNWSNPPTTVSNDYPMVYSTGNTQVYRKTDGFDGTCSNPTSIVIERGIVVGCS